jgi:Mn2+/Fe2+ NRAMP family transporter
VIVRGSYKPVERVLLLLSLIYFAYPVSAFLAKPDWKLAITTRSFRSSIPIPATWS